MKPIGDAQYELNPRLLRNTLPDAPGVYLFVEAGGRVIYVGKAKNLRKRVLSYFRTNGELITKTGRMMKRAHGLDFILTDTEQEAFILEGHLIKKYMQRYNINLRDDKSYPYIRITNEPVPRIFVTRRIIKDGSKYLGPYTDVRHLRGIMKTVRKIFPIRSCKFYLDDDIIARKKVKVCLDYHIKRCQGPCEGLVSIPDYRKMIDQVEKFLRGKTRDLLEELKVTMASESQSLHFENAARIRDQIQMIENYYFTDQKVALADLEDRDILALANEGDDACMVVFRIRDGKVIGRQHFYLKGVEEKTPAQILSQFLQLYDLDSDFLPNQILLPEEPEDDELIREWLRQRANHAVELSVPKIGEKKKLISLCQKNAKFLLDDLMLQKMKKKDYVAHSVKMLQNDLNLKNPPKHIEAFDISNLQGRNAVASMVYFLNGNPKKSEYRRFKIKTKDTPDDFAMMREVVGRRYRRILKEKKELPDL
ncbi:MAG: excinuclease ABC subunit UvrC, partial [Anaerolineales bacterium]